MIQLHKRGAYYHADCVRGGVRLRGSLGTDRFSVANALARNLGEAIAEGRQSRKWTELRSSLPARTYARFSIGVGAAETGGLPALLKAFRDHMRLREKMGKMSASTAGRYDLTLNGFSDFLGGGKNLTPAVMERYRLWRLEDIRQKPNAKGGKSVDLDMAILHRLFAYGVENGLVDSNPVKLEGKPGAEPERGAEPFSTEELARMRAKAQEDRLLFLVLRYTGLRVSDAVALRWGDLCLENGLLEMVTQKRAKKVSVPLHQELLAELRKGSHLPSARVLWNLKDRKQAYHRVRSLGERAGVERAHPHRFRDTLAVDLLIKGATVYDVAKVLGDEIKTVEAHYAPFVSGLQERVRGLMENEKGLEAA